MVSGICEPYKSKTANLIDLIDETFVILTMYTLICFTDFVAEKTLQNFVGTGLIVFISIGIGINLTVIFAQNASLLARSLKISWLKLKLKWALEERTEARIKAAL